MTYFWKAIGFILIGVILWLVLHQQKCDIAILLIMAVCCGVISICAAFLAPVLDLVQQLTEGNLEQDLLQILLRAVGIGLTAELASLICRDAGSASLSAMARFLGNVSVLYLSVPVYQTLIGLIREILGVL